MKDSTTMNLVDKRENLQRMLKLQREIIAHNVVSNSQRDQDKFPRSHVIQFIYSAKGLSLARILFKQVIRKHPRISMLVNTLGQLLLKDSVSKPKHLE